MHDNRAIEPNSNRAYSLEHKERYDVIIEE